MRSFKLRIEHKMSPTECLLTLSVQQCVSENFTSLTWFDNLIQTQAHNVIMFNALSHVLLNLASVSQSTTNFKRVQKWLKINPLTFFTMVLSKSLKHTVVVKCFPSSFPQSMFCVKLENQTCDSLLPKKRSDMGK